MCARASSTSPTCAATSASIAAAYGRSPAWPLCAIDSPHSAAWRRAAGQSPSSSSTRASWKSTNGSECSSPRSSASSCSAASRSRASLQPPVPQQQQRVDPVRPAEDLRPAGVRIQRQRALDLRHRHPVAGQRVEERDVRERVREQRRLAQLLGQRERRARVHLRRGDGLDRVRAPREALLDLDPQRDVDVGLGQRPREDLGGGAEPVAVRAHPAEPGERVRAVAARRRLGQHLVEQRPRALGVAGLEVALGGLDAARPARPGREPPRLLEQRRGGGRRAAGAGPPRRVVERGRDGLVRRVGGEREVPRPLLRLVDERRRAARGAPACRRPARRRPSREGDARTARGPRRARRRPAKQRPVASTRRGAASASSTPGAAAASTSAASAATAPTRARPPRGPRATARRGDPRPARAARPGPSSRPSSSSAKNGLPPDSRCSRAASGRGTGAPRRSASARARSASRERADGHRARRLAAPAAPRPRRAARRAGRRAAPAAAPRTRARSRTRRRATARRRPRRPSARARSTPSSPSATARCERLLARLGPQQRHLQRVPLRRGQRAQLLVGHSREQVAERRVGSCVSASTGRQSCTRHGARATASFHSAVLPAPELALEQQRRRAVGDRREERVDLLPARLRGRRSPPHIFLKLPVGPLADARHKASDASMGTRTAALGS